MSWAPTEHSPGTGRRGQHVTSQYLEDRINMYISAMDKASSMNDEGTSSLLQRDIQHLVDLMERVTSGQAVMETEVPPPLIMTPVQDNVANPLGELSSRLSEYHKALYFAEEELSEGRLAKIQNLQKGLQKIHNLQKRAQAGFPIKENEIPPPVNIPSDSEFDNDAVNTIMARLEQYKSSLNLAENSTGTDRRRIPKLESCIRTLEFLLTRAQAKRPVWRRDIPPEFDYYSEQSPESKVKSENIAKLTLQCRALQIRVSKVDVTNSKLQEAKNHICEGLVKLMNKWSESKAVCVTDSPVLDVLSQLLDKLEISAEEEANPTSDLTLIDLRIQEYKIAALKTKRDGNVAEAIQHLKVMKGLQSMKDTLTKGQKVDMTLVPPPPKDTMPEEEIPPGWAAVTSSATASTEAAPVSAHAQVSPYNLKPAPETAEDKLARKLTSFLEDEGGMKSLTSTSSSSSIESELSPSRHPNIENEKTQVFDELENEALLEEIYSKSNVDISDSSVIDKDSTHSNSSDTKGSSSSALESKSGHLEVGAVDNVSNDDPASLKDAATRNLNSVFLATAGDSGVQNSNAGSLFTQNKGFDNSQDVIDESSVTTEEKKEAEALKEVESKDQKDFKEQIVASEKEDKEKISGSLRKGSKNPLDAIGFLACQGIPESSLAEIGNQTNKCITVRDLSSPSHSSRIPQQNSPSLQMETNDISEKHITNNSQDRNQKDLNGNQTARSETECSNNNSLSSSSVVKQDFDEVMQSAVAMLNAEDNLSSGNVHSMDSSVASNFSDTETNENDLQSLENSALSLPYSVNNQQYSENGFSHQTLADELGLKSLVLSHQPRPDQIQDQLRISSESKVKDTNIHSVSSDDKGFEDSSDLQDFQDLMDSMNLYNENENISDEIHSAMLNFGSYIQSQDKKYNSKLASVLGDLGPTKDDNTTCIPSVTDQLPSPLYLSSTIPVFPAEGTETANYDKHSALVDKHSFVTSGATASSLFNGSNSTTRNTELCGNSNVMVTSGSHQPCKEHNVRKSLAEPFIQIAELTGLETLKYDMLLAASKTSEMNKLEAEKLKDQMEKIKDHLRRGGRKEWEDYKECLESELQLLNDEVKSCGDRQEWDTYKYLNNKRMLNERELSYLKNHIVEVED